MRKKIKVLILLLTICIVSSSCSILNNSGKNNNTKNNSQLSQNSGSLSDSGGVRGGTLNIFSTIPDTLNPILTNNLYVKDFSSLIFESMVKINASQKAEPLLADKWDVSENGLIWTFHIRDGVEWHDKIPFTAEDIEFTVNTILNPSVNTIYKKNLENIITFAALDRSTFRIILKKPYSFTAELMTFPIIPKHCYSGEDILNSSRNNNPVGTGPYKFIKYKQNDQIDLSINDNWWGSTDKDAHSDGPFIAEIDIKIYVNGKDSINAFQTKDIDMASIETGQLNRYNSRLDSTVEKFPGNNFEFLAFNLSNPALGDKNVRKAFAYAIDKNEIINEILPGEAVAADIPLIPGNWMYDNDNQSYTPDAAKARELLKSSGWLENNGIFYKYINGIYTPLNFELLVNDDNDLRGKVAEKICNQLKTAGINVSVRRINWNDQINLINSRKFDLTLMGYQVSSIPDLSFAYSSAAISTGMNISGYSSADVDDYLNRIAAENDNTAKKALLINMKSKIMDDIPLEGLYFYYNGVIFNKKIKGEFVPNIWNKYGGITKMYIPLGK